MSDYGMMSALGSRPNSGNSFPDPFFDMASGQIPDSHNRIMRLSEFIFLSQGTYRQAIERVLSYFITDVEVDGDCGDDEKEKYKKYLNQQLVIKKLLHTIARDFLAYGNSFVSVIQGFRRYLVCPKCSSIHPFRTVAETPAFQFKWQNYTFTANCPRCHFRGDWGMPVDRKGGPDDLSVKRWSPHDMELAEDPFTGHVDFIWKIPPDYRKLVMEGKVHVLERAHWDIIQAVKQDKYFRFGRDVVFHLKDDCLAGFLGRGWGVPTSIVNYRQLYYTQVLNRLNESIALDFVTPLRVLTPDSKGGADPAARDHVLNANLGSFVARVQAMLRRRRKDPASWQVLPYPLQYQALGGDARNLAPRELLDQGLEVLLNNIGVPIQLYKGDLSVQAAPAALRLFESQWNFLVSDINSVLQWLGKKLSKMLSWEDVNLHLTRVTHADDAARQNAILQLMTGGQVSQTTGLKSVSVDMKEELRRKIEEQRYQAELERKAQEADEKSMSMQQMLQQPMPGQPAPGAAPPGQGGDPAAGGAPAQGQPSVPGAGPGLQGVVPNMPSNPNSPITPQDLLGRASSMAQQLIALPDAQRRSALNQIRGGNPLLHSLVRSSLDQLRSQARSTGQALVIQQMQGK